MKHSFLNKPSFLALCVVLMIPCYLPAMEEGDKDGEKPGKAVPSSVVSTSGGVAAAEDLPPPYEAEATVTTGAEVAKAEKSDDEDDEMRALRDQLTAQEIATKQATERAERAQVRAAKKASLLQRIAQLKAEEANATQAAIAALEARPQEQAAAAAEDAEAQRLGADVDARRAAIAALEDEVEDLDAPSGGAASGRSHAQEKRWTSFSKEWSEKKAARQAEGRKGLSDADKVKRETDRVVTQVRDTVEAAGKGVGNILKGRRWNGKKK